MDYSVGVFRDRSNSSDVAGMHCFAYISPCETQQFIHAAALKIDPVGVTSTCGVFCFRLSKEPTYPIILEGLVLRNCKSKRAGTKMSKNLNLRGYRLDERQIKKFACKKCVS
jgi:hypothetical protein